MKEIRQAKILELIKEYAFDTQEELQQKLNEAGFRVTQATVSRDIRELGLVKSDDGDGVYKYRASSAKNDSGADNAFASILRHASVNVACANNLIVVKTYAGMGSAAGAAVDAMDMSGVVGTLAGDDTLLIIAENNESAGEIAETLEGFIRQPE